MEMPDLEKGESWASHNKHPSLLTPRSHPFLTFHLPHHTGPWSQSRQRSAAQQDTEPSAGHSTGPAPGAANVRCPLAELEKGQVTLPLTWTWLPSASLHLPDSLSQDWILLSVPSQLEETPLQGMQVA